MKKRKMFLRMIFASLLRRRSRMIVALLSVAIGATILSGLVSIYYDVPRQMGAQFRNYGANMIFTASGDELELAAVNNAAALIPDEEKVGVAPYRYENVRVRDIPVVAAGTDPEGAKATSPYWSVDGNWFTGAGEMMVGANVAESFRIKTGDMLEVTYTPMTDDSAADADNVSYFTVTGILQTGGSEENYIYMTLDDMSALTYESDRVDLAELSISAGAEELSGYADKINAADDVHASLVKRVTASEATVLTKLQALVLLVTVIVLALTMITGATTSGLIFTASAKEIGLRKAIGASDRSIIREFMGEGMLLGLFGGIVGSVLGFVFAEQVSVNVFGSSLIFRPLLVPITVIASIAVTGISSLMPIKSATEVDPALVLKGE